MEEYQTIDWEKASTFKVELCWKTYYARFKEEHGYPILYKGRLLFPDGWTYSATDCAGPEWCPPTSASVLLSLRLSYWSIRLAMNTEEHRVLKSRLENLRRMQQDRDVPLQQRTVFYDDELNKRVAEVSDLDLDVFQGRYDWLVGDMLDCVEQIREIEESLDASTKK